MTPTASRRKETVERGQALYEQSIRATVEAEHKGQFVVIDVDSGEFEVDRNMLTALDRLRLRRPSLRPYAVRVGYMTAASLDGALLQAH